METVWLPGGLRLDIHLDGDATGGAFCLLVDHPAAGWSLPAHRHAHESETIHVVEGVFEIEVGGSVVEAGPGETVHVPAGIVHAGRCVSGPGRRVLVFSPAGIEGFFRESGTAAPDAQVDPAAALASARRHGWEFV